MVDTLIPGISLGFDDAVRRADGSRDGRASETGFDDG